ncbi:MAG: beta-galactosidase [Clostridiales bacterium]|nr:beta-galactosidase [Clostridiales bacterium]
MSQLTAENKQFMLDGKPFRVISGAIHYFRVVPEYWESSLKKLKACGFNTVETYTCWNLHERKKGQFDFSGGLDIERFFTLAQEIGLKVLFRPGPYTCAEWEWGGFPSWMLNEPGLEIRCDNEKYLKHLNDYVQELYRRIGRFYADKGGPIILTQVENEYGSYGNDAAYMIKMRDMLVNAGATGLLITADGNWDSMLTGGITEGCIPAVNFSPYAVNEQFDAVEKRGLGYPLMCGEFWGGQFDSWANPRRWVSPDSCAKGLDEIFSRGASVNYYMFQGGTNFGMTNGANYYDKYTVTTSSYDYNAPLSEAGDRTEKYYAIKSVIEKHFGPAPEVEVTETEKCDYGTVALTHQADLLAQRDKLPAAQYKPLPMTMEELGLDFGFVLYSSDVRGPIQEGLLDIGDVRDRAHVFIDGKLAGIVERDGRHDEIHFGVEWGKTSRIDILVENRGRVNFGRKMRGERKGILDFIRLYWKPGYGEQILMGWNSQAVPLDDLCNLDFQPGDRKDGPILLKGTFQAETLGDTFLYLPGFTRGVAFINGRCLGRYWRVGPQQTLYVPAPWLKEGENELVIMEMDGAEKLEARLIDHPILDELHEEYL